MKKWFTAAFAVILALCMSTTALAVDVALDETNFPDEAFRNYLSILVPDNDGTIPIEDGAAGTWLVLIEQGITNLKGIEFFYNLKGLDVSKNSFSTLNFDHNVGLESLFCSDGNLTSLNIRACTKLNYFDCRNNNLTELDVSQNTALKRIYCDHNKITSLDVSNNPELVTLSCSDNALTVLDVSNNPKLVSLGCLNNAEGFHLIVAPDSYALQYAIDKNIPYTIAGTQTPAIDPALTGFTTINGAKVFVDQGAVYARDGLINDPANPADWYFCSAGVVREDVTQLVLYDNAWFYVVDGKLDTTYVGIVDYDGGRFLVAAGRIMTEVNGLNQDPATGAWFYYANGQIQTQYTGLAQYDGAWFYIVEGRLDETFTGDVQYDGAWFHVVNSQMVG